MKFIRSISDFGSVLLLISGLFFTGCVKEKFDPSKFDASLSLQPGLAVPIGYSHVGFDKYLTDSSLQKELHIASDGFLSLYYNALLDSGIIGNLLTIPDVSYNNQLINQTGSVIFLTTPGAFTDVTDTLLIPVTSTQANARIDSLSIMSGNLQVIINASGVSGSINYNLDGLQQNGIPFNSTRNLANPDLTLNLSNYTVIPVHDASGNNFVRLVLSVHLQTPSGPVAAGAAILSAAVNLTGLNYETLYGDFSGWTLNIPSQTFATPFFKQLEQGHITFADPRFKIYFSNSAGVPVGIWFNSIDAISRNNGHFQLTGPGVPLVSDPKIIRYPAMNQAGATVNDSLILNSSNSNLQSFIATNPDSITIRTGAKIVSQAPSQTYFIRYDSKYKVTARVELPLWGKADLLFLIDTLNFDYLNSSMPPPKELEKLIIRISMTNSFPLTVYPQIYMLDASYSVLDSLFTGKEKIQGATDTNGDGKSDPFKEPPIDIDLPRSRIDNLFNTRFIVGKVRIMTTDFPALDVKLYSSYFLDYNIGAIAQLKITTGKK